MKNSRVRSCGQGGTLNSETNGKKYKTSKLRKVKRFLTGIHFCYAEKNIATLIKSRMHVFALHQLIG